MARIRTVKPDFFRHELLQDLEITYPVNHPMLVFAALWGHCDKAGRFEWRPRMLKLDILPFLPFDMAETLGILEKAKLIEKYTVGDVDYGVIHSFSDHQRIGGKEAQESEKFPPPFPAPDRGSNGEATVKHSGSNGEATGIAGREGKGKEGNGVIASSANALSAGNGTAICYIPLNDGSEFGVSAEQFAEFEKLYPAVDVQQTLNEIRGWNLANPSRKKTRRGVLSHVNSWLSKEQNRGPQR